MLNGYRWVRPQDLRSTLEFGGGWQSIWAPDGVRDRLEHPERHHFVRRGPEATSATPVDCERSPRLVALLLMPCRVLDASVAVAGKRSATSKRGALS